MMSDHGSQHDGGAYTYKREREGERKRRRGGEEELERERNYVAQSAPISLHPWREVFV